MKGLECKVRTVMAATLFVTGAGWAVRGVCRRGLAPSPWSLRSLKVMVPAPHPHFTCRKRPQDARIGPG